MRLRTLVFPFLVLILGLSLEGGDKPEKSILPQEYRFDRQQALDVVRNTISKPNYAPPAPLDFNHSQFGSVKAADVCRDPKQTINVILVFIPFQANANKYNCYYLYEYGNTLKLYRGMTREVGETELKSHIVALKSGELFDCPH